MNQKSIRKKWKATNDIYGHKPKFDITCPFCGEDMYLRHSTIAEDRNVMAYKCPTCAWFIKFHVMWDKRYLSRIGNTFRNGLSTNDPSDEKGFFVPIEDFKKNELIKQRLADLGYI